MLLVYKYLQLNDVTWVVISFLTKIKRVEENAVLDEFDKRFFFYDW